MKGESRAETPLIKELQRFQDDVIHIRVSIEAVVGSQDRNGGPDRDFYEHKSKP